MRLFGVRYQNGKIMFFKASDEGTFSHNPGVTVPDWAVDIREIIAMIFVGIAAICLIWKEQYHLAETILVGLLCYATGRTIPSPTRRSEAKKKPS